MEEKEGSVRVLNRSLDVLECFTQDTKELTLKEISEMINLSSSTVLRLLKVLEKREYLVREEVSKKYSLGPKFRYFAHLVNAGNSLFDDLESASEESLALLKKEYNETASIYTREANQRVCVERLESDHSLRVAISVGEHLPLRYGAAGKVLLAGMEDDDICGLFGNEAEKVLADIQKCRKQGYWVSNGERAVGSSAIAAPVRDAKGRIIAAVALSGPAARLINEELTEKVMAVMEEGRKISKNLGYYPEK